MRGNLSEQDIEYLEEIEQALKTGELSEDDIVTIDDQLMTAKQAVTLMKEDSLTSRTYHARKTQSRRILDDSQ